VARVQQIVAAGVVTELNHATRNLALLLGAARELIHQSGTNLVMNEVARRAGVGNATLYRNFPTRADLLVAVYQDEVDALCGLGRGSFRRNGSGDHPVGWSFLRDD